MSTARSRARNYWPKVKPAADGGTAPGSAAAMREGWNWMLSELRQLDELRPADADAARWHVAFQLGLLAESLPKRTRERQT